MYQTHKQSRWLSILLTFAMLLTMLPTMAFAAEGERAAEKITTPLDFYDESTPAIGPGYSWDAASGTLTLSGINMDIQESTNERGDILALCLPGNATIVLEDGTDNTIKIHDGLSKGHFIAIKMSDMGTGSDLTIKGGGTLNLEVSGSTNYASYQLVGIENYENAVIVESGTVNMKITSTGGKKNACYNAIGIKAHSVKLKGGNVNIDVFAEYTDSEAAGIYNRSEKTRRTELEVTGGTLFISSNRWTVMLKETLAPDTVEIKGSADKEELPDAVTQDVTPGTIGADSNKTKCDLATYMVGEAATKSLLIRANGPAFTPVGEITGVPTAATAGTDLTLTGTVTPDNATNKTIVWSVSESDSGETGAVVEGGILKTTAAGTAKVTATITDGLGGGQDYTADFEITIGPDDTFVPVTGITGVPTSAITGTDLTLTGTVEPANATNRAITWTVTEDGGTGAAITDGKLKTTAAGTVKVTATVKDGTAVGADFNQEFIITVTESSGAFTAVTDITGVPAAATTGTDLTLTGTVEPANATNKAITWTVTEDGGTGAAITDGKLKTTAAGTVKVTATIKDGTAVGADFTKEFTITVGTTKGKVSVAWKNLIAVYNGTVQEPDASILTGAAEGDMVSTGELAYQLGGIAVENPTNAGTYTVSTRLTGADADKYTLTNPTATFIIQRAPVIFTVAGELVQQDGSPKNPSVTAKANDIAFTDFTVTYQQGEAAVAAPTAAGSYDIYAEITDGNYRHSDDIGGGARKIGVLTIYEATPPATYSVTFASGGATGSMQALANVVEGAVRILPANGFTKDGWKFMGWNYDGRTYQPGDTFTQPKENVTFTAVWQQLQNISGSVKMPDEAPVEGAAVRLMLGSTEIGQAVSGADGTYVFNGVAPGVYNLTAAKDGITSTSSVTIAADSLTVSDITLPAGRTNSVVEVEAGTPALVIGNLDQFFTVNPDAITPDGQEALNDGGSVEIKLKATVVDENTEIMAEAQKNAAEVKLYLDLTLLKTVKDKNDAQVGEPTPVTETSELLSAVIQLPGYLQGEPNYVVFREHNGSIEKFTTTPNQSGEYIEFNGERTEITIYAKKFSTYGVAVTPYLVTFNPNGGTCATTDAVVGDTGKLTTLPTPTRSNYTFDGWYTAATGGSKISLDTVYTDNTTLYAHWTYSGGGDGGSGGGGGGSSSSIKNTVDVPRFSGGSVSVNPQSAAKGAAVTLTVTPDSGYVLDSLTVTDKDGKEVKLTDKGGGKYTFTMPGSKVSISASFIESSGEGTAEPAGLPFTDVEADAWYADAVKYVYENGLMKGTSATAFAPNMTTTRGMIATILYRMEGGPSISGEGRTFPDVPADEYYTEAVAWSDANGVMIGYGSGMFGPDDLITREQLALVLYRYAQYKGESVAAAGDLSVFPDQPSSWAAEGMMWAAGAGLVSGKEGGVLDPRGLATRAEVAVMLQRFLNAQ